MPDVGINQAKIEFLIIFLLVNDIIKRDVPPLKVINTRIPYPDAISFSPVFEFDNIKSNKAKGFPEFNGRQCGYGFIL
jgi:hypothetical protein